MTLSSGNAFIAASLACAAAMLLAPSTAVAEPPCGDGICDGRAVPPETSATCPRDCGPVDFLQYSGERSGAVASAPIPVESYSNRCLFDVVATFNAIPASVPSSKYLRVNMSGFQYPRYTSEPGNSFECTSVLGIGIGGNGCGNHFQGFVRLRINEYNPHGQYAVVSGGDPHDPGSDLFLVKMGSRSGEEWTRNGGNLSTTDPAGPYLPNDYYWIPDSSDVVIRKIRLFTDTAYWHAGGMQSLGDIIVIPVEGQNLQDRSRVVFWNFRDPNNPWALPVQINRYDNAKGGAVMTTRLIHGPEKDRFLVGVWSDSDSKGKRIDFYLSHSDRFEDGFPPGFAPTTVWWHSRPLPYYPFSISGADASEMGGDRNFSDYQTVNLVNQCDGKLFLLGMHNTSGASPTFSGRDFADLFRLEFPNGYTGTPHVVKVANKHMYCHDHQCNHDGGPGIYLPSRGERLWLYSVYHWRNMGRMRLNEYSVSLPAEPGDPGDPPPPPNCGNFDYSQCQELQTCQSFCLIGDSSPIGHPCCGCICTGFDECPLCLDPG